ncbi:AcrR family transcriptional regulator [Xanthomonas arboricola]|uniref:TetR/AcrR family transcriptional regulator n=1 Tax=Xanthomonas euroxanthea TaxID=2259622 RepID=UPI00141AEBEA|nr:TetR/AcrR family transcriptional regulator [Xanthomonas euroxanthea]MBB3777823.1 AcrR family transcriptional regulator [Xanthomonas euroxanthea]NIK40459.1 AcrR family transcriptional regulator [Xanthomonas euroxanthea]
MSPTPAPRRPRADAARNQSQILKVALQAFKEEGLGVSMDSIARRAGVGPGTLYRHFPNRDALLAALLLGQHYEKLLATRVALSTESDAGQALDRWVVALGRWMNAYEGLPEPLRAGWMQPGSALGPACGNLVEATDEFLKAAQRAGQARPSLSGRDLFLSALAVAWAAGASQEGGTRATLHELIRSGWIPRASAG